MELAVLGQDDVVYGALREAALRADWAPKGGLQRALESALSDYFKRQEAWSLADEVGATAAAAAAVVVPCAVARACSYLESFREPPERDLRHVVTFYAGKGC